MKATLALDPRYLCGCLCGDNRKAENIIAILGHHFVFLSHCPKCKHLNIFWHDVMIILYVYIFAITYPCYGKMYGFGIVYTPCPCPVYIYMRIV